MAWVMLDDKFHSNPKVLKAGLDGAGLYVRALTYCGDHLTDGLVPIEWVREVAPKRIRDKVTVSGLWVEVAGGYRIPDYLVYNPSKSDVEERRQKEAERKASYRLSRRTTNGTTGGTTLGTDGGSPGGNPGRSDRPPAPAPVPLRTTNGSRSGTTRFPDLDSERGRELDRILDRIRNVDFGTAGVLASYGRQLPFGALAKVRESVESQPAKVAAGWVVNALKDEIRERAA